MSDTSLNRIIQYGTQAERIAFIPDPAVSSQVLYLWYETDNPPDTYAWDGSDWVQINAVSGGSSRQYWEYRARTGATSGYPNDGHILWDNATQISANNIIIAHLTQDNIDIDIFLAFLAVGDTIVIQDSNSSADNQIWEISGTPVNTNPGMSNSYWTVPVTLTSSAGAGTTGFANNNPLILAVFPATVTGGITQLTGHVTAGPGSGSQAATINVANRTRSVTFIFDGAGSVIPTNQPVYIQLPVACTLIGWTILAQDGLTGSIQIDIWADTYANFPPTDADSITGGNEPEIVGATKNTDSDISDWSDVTMPAGTILAANVDSVATFTKVSLQLLYTVD